jgi:hypothetical protein
MKIILFIIWFLLIGAFLIISNENIYLNNSQNINHFFNIYSIWLNNMFINSENLIGNVIKNFIS